MILPIYPSSSQRSIYNHKSISPKLSPSRFSFIRSRLPDPSYDFKKSMNIRHSNCAVYTDLFYYNNGFHNFLRKVICFVTSSNTLQYCFNVVFLFYSFLVITVYSIYSTVQIQRMRLQIRLHGCFTLFPYIYDSMKTCLFLFQIIE